MLTKMRESNSFSWSITKTKRYGVALFNFKATRQHEIPLDIGECVHIAEECCGWYRGFSASDKTKKGIFPANYIYIKPFKVDESSSGHDSIVLAEDPISREVVTSLREWHRIASRKIFMKRSIGDEELHNRINSAIMDLISMRMQLINGTLTQDQIRDIKIKITNKLDWGNRILQLDLVPRIEGEIADAELISPIELYDLHLRSADLVKTNSVRSSQTSVTSVLSNYLYLHIRDVNLSLSNPEDSFEIAFSLIDATNQISEKFITKISSHVNNIGKLSLSTVFTDISTLEVTRDLQLHVQVFRVGRMLLVEGKTRTSTLSKDNSANHVRRPYGSAVYSLADVFKADGTEKEVAIKLFSCSNENDYFQLHDMLLRKQTNKLNQLQNSTIIISMKVMTGSNLAKVSTEHPLIFKNVTCLTEKWGFPDIILPGDVRNDLYLTLESGEFEKGGKSIPKNIEAVIALIGAEGIVIKKSVSPGSGSEPITSYNSVVLYHNNNPKWMEPVKLLIPLDVFDVGAHVRFEFRHCSAKDSSGSKEKKVLGFSFIPLSDENGTILRDGTHEMHVYKALDSAEARIKACDPSYYLRIPFGPRDIRSNLNTGSSLLVRSVKECVIIRTLLCSTKLTQNGDLLSLLKWKDDPNMAEQALINVLKLNGEEIVKFLQDILDSLFDMFSTPEGNSTKFTGLVFRVLIHIVLLLEDKKYEQFKPVLDNYICGHFSAALVYQGLLACTIQACDLIKDPGKQDAVQRCFMSLSWIFKFIVQSRILFARATGDSNEERFKQDLFALFASFNRILSLTHDREIIQSQVTLIENLPSTYDELLRVLAPTDLARVIKLTINCLPFADQAPEITKAKLKCISDTIDNEKLFSENEARNQLLDVFCQHFKEHIIKHQELKMSAKLISDILVYLHKDKMSLTWKCIL
ncbi:Dedicator of cytokinesis protein 3 [Halotydeus destructor]|nr:Dedicator of cytokinesis protein 3 [Halotydeus destructor]